MQRIVYIGFDARFEHGAFAVARSSCRHMTNLPIPIKGLVLSSLIEQGLYKRPFEYRQNEQGKTVIWDLISDAPQSTEHANSRFLVPHLCQSGWALFCDGDVLFRANIDIMFKSLDPKYAVYCVKHEHHTEQKVKMDGQAQSNYSRKNWSSFMVFNCDHPSNKKLTLELFNSTPGRDLHRFCWLQDDEIGELHPTWNFLVGHTDKRIIPSVVHFTDGVPDMPGYENSPYAQEWRNALRLWAQ